MADGVFSLYPSGSQGGQTNLLANPAQTINALQGLTLLQQQQMALQGQRAFGRIYSQHVTPDGVDTAGILQDAANDPAAAMVLPQYTGTVLQQRGQMINNATNWLALNGAQSNATMGFFSSLPDSANPDDVRNAAATWARLMPSIPGGTSGPIISGVMGAILNNPNGVGEGIREMRNIAIGPQGISQPTAGAPGIGGAPTRTTIGQANLAGGTFPVGLPIGAPELMAGSAQRALALENTANTTGQYHADLENLLTDSQIIGQKSGVTIEAEKKLNETLQRFGIPGLTLNPQEVGAAESFDKISNQIAANQAQFVGAGTDAGRNMIAVATPGLTQSQLGREGVIAMLQGNQDFIDHMRKMWLASPMHDVPGSFNQFVSEMVTPTDPNRPAVDPRVFQFNRMNQAERQIFLNGIRHSGQLAEFERRYKYAADPTQGWVPPLQQQTQQTSTQ
jgi:hypothetical protein